MENADCRDQSINGLLDGGLVCTVRVVSLPCSLSRVVLRDRVVEWVFGLGG